MALFNGHAGDYEVAAIQVWGAIPLYLEGGGGGDAINNGLLLQGVASSVITTADFV